MKLLGFAWVAVLAAVLTLAAGAAASPEMTDDNMLMMTVMGGGIEDGSAGAEPALVASSASAPSPDPAGAPGVRPIDVEGATATRAFGINAAGQVVGSYTDATATTHGLLWINGNTTKIAVPGASSTEAWGINP